MKAATVTTRRKGVATRSGAEEKKALPSRRRPGLSTLCKPTAPSATRTLTVMSTLSGWLRRGSERLTALPLSLRPYRGPENRSQFGAREDSLRVVREGV